MWRTLAVVVIIFSLAVETQAAGINFLRPLKLGMSGEDVRQLQIVLNKTPETRVADTGAGSPGQETSYFGLKTQQAVIRFQEKYRSVVLIPNGLTKGSGYVGPSTIAVLTKTPTVTSVAQTIPTPTPVTTAPPEVKPKLPGNVEGLAGTLSTIERVGAKKGLSVAQIDKLKAVVSKDVMSTTTPLLASFAKQVYKDNPGQQPITLESQIKSITLSFRDLVMPEYVLAATLAVPFGGAIIGTPIWCLCTASWWIPITPLPPTMAEALMYFPGSQAFLSYNIPATIWLLGLYEPGPQCLIYDGDSCIPLPVEGLITPIVGSSLI